MIHTIMEGDILMKYGLIGEKLGHSYSKLIHERLAGYTYDLIPLSPEAFRYFMARREFTAINVTIPYKQGVIPYLDYIHPLAGQIGAVNAIVNRDGKLYGYNTDYYGFKYLLEHNGIEVCGRKCLILGHGGTSRTVQAVLKCLNASKIVIASRKPDTLTVSYEDCYSKHSDVRLIVNTTPAGMYPKVDEVPIDLTSFTACEAVVDVIFNPLKTKLALQAEALGKKTVTGLLMLVAQAKEAAEIFLNIQIDESRLQDVYNELLEMISK